MEESNAFIDLASYQHIDTASVTAKSNIIKAEEIKSTGGAMIDVMEGNHEEPTVFVHRKGDQVVKIEFVCSCGKSTHVDLEYEGE